MKMGPANKSSELMSRKMSNRRLAFALLLMSLGFLGFGFALVPLYNSLCHATGLNGKTDEAEARPDGRPDLSRTVTVEFTSTVMPGLPWQFRPTVRHLMVHPGEPATAVYVATNTSGAIGSAQAIMSVTPEQAATHFKKIECFCYHRQELKPGQSRAMPVVFFIARDLPKEIATITLSYSAFPVAQEAALKGEN